MHAVLGSRGRTGGFEAGEFTLSIFAFRMVIMAGYSSPTLAVRDMFQGPPWMTEITDIMESYIYYVFSYICIPMRKFTL